MSFRVSVIVPTLGRDAALIRCLSALRQQSYPRADTEIIVVNNLPEEAAQPISEFSDVRWAVEPRRGSYAARNCGLGMATGEIIAFTDDDCIPAPTWLEEGVRTLESTGAGLVGGRINFINPTDRRLNVFEVWEEMNTAFTHHRWLIEHDKYAVTANLMTRRAIFDRVGVFDAELRSGGDKHWTRLAVTNGETLRYADAAVVSHPRRSTLAANWLKRKRVAGGMVVAARRHGTGFSAHFNVLYRGSLLDHRLYVKIWQEARRHRGLGGPASRLSYFFLSMFMSGLTTQEKIKVLMGRHAYSG